MAIHHDARELINAINVIAAECGYNKNCSCGGCPFLLDGFDFCGIVSAHMKDEWRKAPCNWKTQEIKIMKKNQYTDELK